MQSVSKVFYDPLLRDKAQIQSLLLTLPIGSAHPFRGELLVRSSESLITTVDISMHPDSYFTNAISISDLGEQVLDRMRLFPSEIGVFNEQYHIQQAPASTFQVPIVPGLIHILAISMREPTYYDLCVGDSACRSCCYQAWDTFKGIRHSGDRKAGKVLLQYIKLESALSETSRTVFVSGYHNYALHRYKKGNPLVLVANHSTKTLYIIPVPLDTATIGADSTICCPLVIQKNAESNRLLCSILPTPTVDKGVYCSGETLNTTAFSRAIDRGNALFEESQVSRSADLSRQTSRAAEAGPTITKSRDAPVNGRHVILATHFSNIDHLHPAGSSVVPERPGQSSASHAESPEVIRFGKGIHWISTEEVPRTDPDASISILPCVLGGIMEGPMLLAIGEPPADVPFTNKTELHEYYKRAKSVVVLVNENMTDNVRNVATTWRLNGLFILQASHTDTPVDGASVISILDNLNINAVTALAGPQSFVSVQLGAKYFFYRGIANPEFVNTASLKFGQDITDIILTHGLMKTAERVHLPCWPRLVDLAQDDFVHLPNARLMSLKEMRATFQTASMDDLMAFEHDIPTIVPQLQALLPQDQLQETCQTLIQLISEKVNEITEPLRRRYSTYVVREYDPTDTESKKKRSMLLSSLRKETKAAQGKLQWFTEALGNIVSTQSTSTRTHDLKRLARQTAIQKNVGVANSMTFEKLSGLLEEHASEMGVLLVNISTGPYTRYISEALYLRDTLPSTETDPCFLDQRVLYLDGLDAGIILEASQAEHSGPLTSQKGSDYPILALPYLNKSLGSSGSMLAWVCWDEFVRLRNPYKVRWMEKCNDPDIAALRILMRNTLSQAVSSRDVENLEPFTEATSQLMGALLMSTMRRLAETRSSIPELSLESLLSEDNSANKEDSVTSIDSLDTSTRLMRGLFGDLLTLAGSGTRPLSYVWQLFGKVPTFEIPTSGFAWSWYEHTTRLIPYAGWPLEQYKANVVGLLDKLILRMITKSEKTRNSLAVRIRRMKIWQSNCEARNIQLFHTRTIVTVLEKILTEQNEEDCKASAHRLLQVVPEHVKNETASYTRLYRYIQHLAQGGSPQSHGNTIAAHVLTKRSAIFREDKQRLASILSEKSPDQQAIIEACQQLLTTKAAIEKTWGLKEGTVKMQNSKSYQTLIDQVKPFNIPKGVINKIRNDAEISRMPWQVPYRGKDPKMEKLDQNLVAEVVGRTSNAPESTDRQYIQGPSVHSETVESEQPAMQFQQSIFSDFQEDIHPEFLEGIENATSMEDVCRLLGITTGAMASFVAMLVPDRFMEVEARLALTFKEIVLVLLRDRNRDPNKVKPTNMLLGICK